MADLRLAPLKVERTKKGDRSDIDDRSGVTAYNERMAQYEADKRKLIDAILKYQSGPYTGGLGSRGKVAPQVGATQYTQLPLPHILQTGPRKGDPNLGPPAKVDRSRKDSNMFFYQALGVQPGDKAAATRELAKLAKQKEIAPHSITPAQDRILASIGKGTDAYNLPIDPESMLRRLLPPPPDRLPVPMAKTNMPMDTQLEIRPEFQNRTDAWRPGIAVPELDPAEQAVQKAFENSGRPVMEGTKTTPTQKDVDSKSRWTKERKNKFDKDVPPIGEDTETDEDGDGGE